MRGSNPELLISLCIHNPESACSTSDPFPCLSRAPRPSVHLGAFPRAVIEPASVGLSKDWFGRKKGGVLIISFLSRSIYHRLDPSSLSPDPSVRRVGALSDRDVTSQAGSAALVAASTAAKRCLDSARMARNILAATTSSSCREMTGGSRKTARRMS